MNSFYNMTSSFKKVRVKVECQYCGKTKYRLVIKTKAKELRFCSKKCCNADYIKRSKKNINIKGKTLAEYIPSLTR